MIFLTDMEKLIVRSWSTIVARGESPTPSAVAALADHSLEAVTVHLVRLRALGAIPYVGLEAVS